MNKNELNKGFEGIRISNNKKEAIWNNIEAEMSGHTSSKRQSRGIKRSLGILAASAAVFAILAIPTTIFADEIKDFVSGIFSHNEQVGEITEQKVFEVTDEESHIKVEVLELISDGHSAMATVVYTALDEKGRLWLEQEDKRDSINRYSLFSIYPGKVEKNGDGDDVMMMAASNSYGCYEVEKLRTEDSRTYIACLSSYGTPTTPVEDFLIFDYSTPCNISNLAKLPYATTEDHVYKMVKADENAEESEAAKKREPVFFEISKLSWRILGRNHGVYGHSENSYWMIDPDDDYKPSVEIYFKNGECMPLEMGFRDCAIDGKINGEKIDLLISSNDFFNGPMYDQIDECDEENFSWLTQIDPSEVVSVKIDGIMYNLQ